MPERSTELERLQTVLSKRLARGKEKEISDALFAKLLEMAPAELRQELAVFQELDQLLFEYCGAVHRPVISDNLAGFPEAPPGFYEEQERDVKAAGEKILTFLGNFQNFVKIRLMIKNHVRHRLVDESE